MTYQTDMLTGEKFVPVRRNQRFLTAKNRITYYNNKAAQLRKEKSAINRPLHVNYNILCEVMWGKTVAVVHKEFLRGKGYDFFVHTHIDEYKGESHPCIYCFIVIRLDGDQIRIVRYDPLKSPRK